MIECYKEIVRHRPIWKEDEKGQHPFQYFQIKMNSFSNMNSLSMGKNRFECWTPFFFWNQINVLFFSYGALFAYYIIMLISGTSFTVI